MEDPNDGEECNKHKIKIEPEVEEDNCDQWLKESSECHGEHAEQSPHLKIEKVEDHSDEEDNYSTYSGYYEDISDISDSEDEPSYNPNKENDSDDEESEEDYQPKTKKGRVSRRGSSLNPCSKKVTKTALRRLCQRGEITELVGSQCKYECLAKDCKRSFRSWGSLNHHFRTNLSHGPADKIEKHLTHAQCHKCHICGGKVLADRGFLNIHMQNKHKMSIEEYCQKYDKKQGGRYMVKQDSMKDILSKCTLSENVVGNMCSFACIGCNGVFDTWISLNSHLSITNHGPRGMENIDKYIVKYISHKCKLCSKIILNDYINLLSHLRIHKLNTIQGYCEKTGITLYDKATKLQSMMDKLGETSPFSKAFDEFCTYSCKTCGEKTKSWCLLQRHLLARKHFQTEKLTTKILPDEEMLTHVTKLVLHECFLCSDKLPCDMYFLKGHLRKKHSNMETQDYIISLNSWCLEETLKEIPTEEPLVQSSLKYYKNMPPISTTHHVGDFCQFTCFMCPMYTISEWGAFKKEHLVPNHNLFHYEPDYCLEARYHKCLLCEMIILSDRHFIQNHIERKHKKEATPTSYYNLVREKGFLVLFRDKTKDKRKKPGIKDNSNKSN